MAIQRDYTGSTFQSNNQVQARDVTVNAGQFQAQREIRAGGDADWQGKLIQDITGLASSQFMNKRNEIAADQYLEGQNAALLGQAEEELQSKPGVRDFAVAGFRDTQGRLALADADADLAVDMKELRKQDPAKFGEYLSKRRQKLLPIITSGSKEQAQAMLGQMAVNDRAAIIKHKNEYQSYIREEERQTQFVMFNSLYKQYESDKIKAVAGTGDDPAANAENLQQSAMKLGAHVVGQVWNNPRLSTEDAQSLTYDMLNQALDRGHSELYEYLDRTEIHDGTGGTVLSRLNPKELVKLSKQYAEARKGNITAANQQFVNIVQQHEAARQTGNYSLSEDEMQQVGNRMIASGMQSEYKSWVQGHYAYQYKNRDQAGKASAYLNGDMNYLVSNGVTNRDAADSLHAMLTKQNTPFPFPFPQRVDTFMAASRKMPEAAAEVGRMIGPMLLQMQTQDANPDPQHQKVFVRITQQLDQMEAEGNTGATAALYSTMPAEQQTWMRRLRAGMQLSKNDPQAAARWATKQAEDDSKLTPQDRAAISAAKAVDDDKEVSKYDTMGYVNRLVRSITDPTRVAVSPAASGVFSNTRVASEQARLMRTELLADVKRVRLTDGTSSSKDIIDSAMGNLLKRTIPSKHSPMYLPQGSTPKTYFGLQKEVNHEVLGQALDRILGEPKTKGGRFVYPPASGGEVIALEYDADGIQTTNSVRINGTALMSAVQGIEDGMLSKEQQVSGKGRTLTQGTASVTYSGQNTAGIRQDVMYNLRENLVNNEGVRNKVYKDTKGNDTVGVGIFNKAYWPQVNPDGTVSNAEISSSFNKASNDAAKAARDMQTLTGLHNDNWTLLFGELAYQSGPAFMIQKNTTGEQYRKVVQASQSKNLQEATAAFKETAAYKVSGEARRQKYLAMLERAIKSN